MNVQSLWNHVLNAGYVVRKTKCDGLKMWQPFKDFYSGYEIEGYETNFPSVNAKIRELSKEVNYKSEDIDHNNVTINIGKTKLTNSKETDHFIIQHFRVPEASNYKLPLVKILQIAFNAGQAKAEFENNTYNEEIVNFYKTNKLSEVTSFISPEVASKTIIPKILSGGRDYFYKYKKYKHKYLTVTNKNK